MHYLAHALMSQARQDLPAAMLPIGPTEEVAIVHGPTVMALSSARAPMDVLKNRVKETAILVRRIAFPPLGNRSAGV